MPVCIDEIAEQLRSRHALPLGISITIDYVTDNILVGNDDVGFCITRANIDDNLYLAIYDETLPRLIEIASDPALIKAVTETSKFIDIKLKNTQLIIDQLFAVRVRNNIPWKRLMEIALKHAPDETRAALREINENDRKVSDLLAELAK